jgi:hypothetical protein
MSKQLWIRVGDGGDYESFDDIASAVEYLNELRVGMVEAWIHAGTGFTTPNYWGNDYISCFWGDDNAQFISGILPNERADFDLEENYL